MLGGTASGLRAHIERRPNSCERVLSEHCRWEPVEEAPFPKLGGKIRHTIATQFRNEVIDIWTRADDSHGQTRSVTNLRVDVSDIDDLHEERSPNRRMLGQVRDELRPQGFGDRMRSRSGYLSL